MTREELRDRIIVRMAQNLNKNQVAMLHTVLNEELMQVEITELQTELATKDNTNEYLMNMFFTFKSQKLSEKTLKIYKFSIEKFAQSINKTFLEVTSMDVEFFLAQMAKSNGETSLNNYRRNLSAFYSWLVKKHIVTFNPCLEVEPYKEIKKPIDHLEATQFEKLKTGCETKRDRAMIEFLRCTALRVEEAIPLKVCDVNFAKGNISVYGEKTKTFRTVFLDDVAMFYLSEYIQDKNLKMDDYLFKSERKDKGLTISGFENAITQIGKRSGVHAYVHLFRKTCATNIIRRGGSIADSGIYLGHKDSTVTGKHYTYIDDSKRKQIFDSYVAAV